MFTVFELLAVEKDDCKKFRLFRFFDWMKTKRQNCMMFLEISCVEGIIELCKPYVVYIGLLRNRNFLYVWLKLDGCWRLFLESRQNNLVRQRIKWIFYEYGTEFSQILCVIRTQRRCRLSLLHWIAYFGSKLIKSRRSRSLNI